MLEQTSSAGGLGGAGDVDIKDITIVTSKGFTQTITPQVLGVEIFEDIFSSFITGRLIVKDSQELTNLLPLVGEEVVRLDIHTPTLPDEERIKDEFFIYKMDDKTLTAERQMTYTLYFMSKEGIIDLNKKVPKAFQGSPSDIVEELCTSELFGFGTKKLVYLEDSQNTIKYVSNFWSPTQNIQYVCDHAVNSYGSPTFIFFENKYGFQFVTLESLYTGSPIKQRFIWDNYTADISRMGGSRRDIQKDYQRVLTLEAPLSFDYIKRLRSGAYGSELITYDIMTHQYVHTSYVPTFEDSRHMNGFPLWSDSVIASPKSVLMRGHNYYNNFEGFSDVTNNKIIQKRKSILSQAEANKVIISVAGRTDYSAGQRVILEVPKRSQITEQDNDWMDKITSGVYLVSALCHTIGSTQGHGCTLELIKDSMMVNLND